MLLETAAQRLAEITQQPVNNFSTFDFGRQQNPTAKSVTIDNSIARDILWQIRQELEPGIITFIGNTRNLSNNELRQAEIAIALSESQFDILRLAQSNAFNFGLETEDIITKLKTYDKKYGIDIFHAELDIIEFILQNTPNYLTAFCEDLYDFCPDIVDQDVNSIEELEEDIMIQGEVSLWWD